MLSNINYLFLFFGISSATNWIINEDFQYLLKPEVKVSWDIAVKECQKKGAELLFLTSPRETAFIISNCPKCSFWLAKDQNQNVEWNGGKVGWDALERQEGNCGVLNSGYIYKMDCSDRNGYICKKKYKSQAADRFKRQDVQLSFGPDTDPCKTYTIWDDNGTRAPQNLKPSKLLCDAKLKVGWYRFNSSFGNRIPTVCVPEKSCGTLQPIWMDGSLPQWHKEIVTRKVCVSSGTNCCASTWDIKIKHCGAFNVYFLPPADKCFRAYCIGIKPGECPECDYGKFPTLTNLPTVSWRIVNSEIEVFCDVNYQKKPPEGRFYFIVNWFIDNKLILVNHLGYNELRSTLMQKYLIGTFGKTFSCQIKGNFEEGPFSPTLMSAGFFNGIQFINPDSSITVKPGKVSTISFKLTLPLICTAREKNCGLQVFAGVEVEEETKCSNQVKIVEAVIKSPTDDRRQSFCGIIITNENWNKSHEILLYGTIHSLFTTLKQAKLKIFTLDSIKRNTEEDPPNIHLDRQIQIEPLAIVDNVCYSLNDPHMKSFDKVLYEHHIPGTFLLYRNKRTNAEVRVFHDHCPGTTLITCNCGVTIKTTSMWITIDRCQNGDMDPNGDSLSDEEIDISIERLDEGRKYQITIESTGTVIEVVESYGLLINIYIRATFLDYGFTEGLCGNFNSDQTDDFTLRDGTVACPFNLGKCPTFSKNWKITEGRAGLTILETKIRAADNSNKDKTEIFCKCSLNKGKLEINSCNRNNNVQICHSRKGKHITPKPKDTTTVIKPVIQENNDEPARTWTEGDARKYCKDYLQNSPTGQFCSKLSNIDFNPKIDFCVLDIMMTKSTVYVQSAVEAVKEECITELNRNTSLWVQTQDPVTGEQIFIPPPDIEDHLCINDCSNKGTCITGQCQCDAGYMGGDCSIKSNQPPAVYYILQNGLCDKQSKSCESIVVRGMNFVNSDKLTCHMETVKIIITPAGYIHQSKVHPNVKALFNTVGEIECPVRAIPENAIDTWNIYVSNNGLLKSRDGILFTVYNSQCIVCTSAGNCLQKENTCLIGERCFKAEDINPENTCEKCKPENSLIQWTVNPECMTTLKPTIDPGFMCPTQAGIYPHFKLCTHFLICLNWEIYPVPCDSGLYYNQSIKRCDKPENVPKCKNGIWI